MMEVKKLLTLVSMGIAVTIVLTLALLAYKSSQAEEIRTAKMLIPSHILFFPVLLMEDILKSAGLFTAFLKPGGKYAHSQCLTLVFYE